MFDYEELEYYHECRSCDENQQVLDEAADLLSHIVKQLYIDGPLDLDQLETDIHDLCHTLKVKSAHKKGPLKICREKSVGHSVSVEPKDILSEWLGFNYEYSEEIRKGAIA